MLRAAQAIVALLAVAGSASAPNRAAAQAPERATIAFTVRVGEGHSEIYLMRSDGSERRRVTGGTVPLTRAVASSSEPAWSPDGTRLALVRQADRDSSSGISTL